MYKFVLKKQGNGILPAHLTLRYDQEPLHFLHTEGWLLAMQPIRTSLLTLRQLQLH